MYYESPTLTGFYFAGEVLADKFISITSSVPSANSNLRKLGCTLHFTCATVTKGIFPMSDLVERIKRFNAGRLPDMLKLKYKAMQADAFAFFRGTCHLFYQDWPSSTPLNQAPATWVCGDLHVENFGSYRGDNGLVYFDMNDFDEAALAPCTWDVARAMTSILVGAHTLNVDAGEAQRLCRGFLEAYADALVQGRASFVERDTAAGMIKELLEGLEQRTRKAFLDSHTEPADKSSSKRRLLIDNHHTLPITSDERDQVVNAINTWAKSQPNPDFFLILDVARRMAGIGSLGVKRYLLLVEGKSSPDHNYLLDLKQELPSALTRYLTLRQPEWVNDAERCMTIQVRMQAVPPALLSNLVLETGSFRLKELQPREDRVTLDRWGKKIERLEALISTLAQITAWAQIRSAGRQGSATADELIAYGHDTGWHSALLDYVGSYARHAEADFETFRAACKQGQIED
jgi:uncharacterized protein (DUF2252 family)